MTSVTMMILKCAYLEFNLLASKYKSSAIKNKYFNIFLSYKKTNKYIHMQKKTVDRFNT